MSKWTNRCIGVALISVSSLMLQVTYTRVFSIALWNHFVWMIVSIALFGFGFSGTFLMMKKGIVKNNLDVLLSYASLLYSISALATYIVSNFVPFDPVTISWDNNQLYYLLFFYLILTTPFFFSGLTSALAIENAGEKINLIYFSSFIGSAFGSVFVLPFFRFLGGSGVIVFTSLVGAIGWLFLSINLEKRTKLLYGWIVILLVILPFSQSLIPMKVSPYKSLNTALRYQNAELIETHWNSYSRVDVVESGYIRYAPGLSLNYIGELPYQIGIFVDGNELNAVSEYNSQNSLDFINFLPSYLPYHLVRNPNTLVVNSGGGLGVLTAIRGNSSIITATEENQIIVELIKGKYSSFSGNIYDESSAEIVVADGRSYIQSNNEEFDLIDLSLTRGSSPASTGLYAVSENYLFTEDSISSLIGHLSDNGILSIQGWLLPPPREDVKVVGLAISALRKEGVVNPEQFIVVYRSWGTINVLVKKTPFTTHQLSSIRGLCESMRFDLVFLSDIIPGEVNRYNKFPTPIYHDIVTKLFDVGNQFYEDYLFDIRPSTDEKPFFFSFLKWDRLIETYNNFEKRWQPLVEGGLLIPIVLVQALFLSILFIILPVTRIDSPIRRDSVLFLSYFFLIGIGYMFIEITTIQRFILVLGNTIYSVSLVLFSLLLSSGVGSLYSNKISPSTKQHFILLASIGGLSILLGLSYPLVHHILSRSLLIRILFTLIFIFPIGFLMGMPFPIGIRNLACFNKEIIYWAWAVNGCASVIGSILPTIIALNLGFSRVYLIAGFTYLTTLPVMLYIGKEEKK